MADSVVHSARDLLLVSLQLLFGVTKVSYCVRDITGLSIAGQQILNICGPTCNSPSTDGVMPANASYWLQAGSSKNDGDVTKTYAYINSSMLDSRLKWTTKSGTRIGSSSLIMVAPEWDFRPFHKILYFSGFLRCTFMGGLSESV